MKRNLTALFLLIALGALLVPAQSPLTTMGAGPGKAAAAGGGSPAFDAATVGTLQSGAGPYTDAHTIGAITNGLLLVWVAHRRDGTETMSDVTWNTTESFTFVERQVQPDNTIELWRLINPTTGTHNVVTNLTGGVAADVIQIIVSVSGAHQTTPLGTAAEATGTTGISVTVGSVGSTDLVIDGFVAEEAGTSYAAGANQTQRALNTVTDSINVGGSTQSGADGGVMSWTATGLELTATIAVAVKPL